MPRLHLPCCSPQRYKYRLIVDESVALGVLGARGRGAAEHFGCAAEDVEIVGGSMGGLHFALREGVGLLTPPCVLRLSPVREHDAGDCSGHMPLDACASPPPHTGNSLYLFMAASAQPGPFSWPSRWHCC